MKTIKFILQKIIIVEVMLLILYFACITFNIHIEIIDLILEYSLKYLTPVALTVLIPYIIISILTTDFISMVIAIIVGGIILKYLGVL